MLNPEELIGLLAEDIISVSNFLLGMSFQPGLADEVKQNLREQSKKLRGAGDVAISWLEGQSK